MCAGNSFVINYICENGTTIPAEETQIADGTTVYTFPFEKVFALQETTSGNIVDSDTIRENIYSIVNKSIDTPTTCEGSNLVSQVMETNDKEAIDTNCSGGMSSACRLEIKKEELQEHFKTLKMAHLISQITTSTTNQGSLTQYLIVSSHLRFLTNLVTLSQI